MRRARAAPISVLGCESTLHRRLAHAVPFAGLLLWARVSALQSPKAAMLVKATTLCHFLVEEVLVRDTHITACLHRCMLA